MCDVGHALPPLEADEYVLDTPLVRALVAQVRASIEDTSGPEAACAAIEPLFANLISDREWLPDEYQADAPKSGMGGGIGQWLLFRSADRSLCLFSLVVPAGSMTPVHDHLAWGLIGLYRGNQDEEIYRPARAGSSSCGSGRSSLATSTGCSRRSTTSTASGRRPMSRPSRSICSRATRAASSGTPMTR